MVTHTCTSRHPYPQPVRVGVPIADHYSSPSPFHCYCLQLHATAFLTHTCLCPQLYGTAPLTPIQPSKGLTSASQPPSLPHKPVKKSTRVLYLPQPMGHPSPMGMGTHTCGYGCRFCVGMGMGHGQTRRHVNVNAISQLKEMLDIKVFGSIVKPHFADHAED
jgi:hypothetical protein